MAAVGIDLGTTNTVIAQDSAVVAIEHHGERSRSLASCVAYPPSGKLIVGKDARRRAAADPHNTILSAKRIIGRAWDSSEVNEYRQRYGARLANDADKGVVFQTRQGNKTPVDVAATVLATALHAAGLKPGTVDAVITVPAAFDARQRAATEEAGRLAGLRRIELLEEPVATALAHGALQGVRYAAVYDVGGGTFDVCVLDCSLYPVGILGHGGDLFLGGDDFDEAIAADVAASLLKDSNWDLRNAPDAFRRLVSFAEKAKIDLSTVDVVNLELAEIDAAFPVQHKWLSLDRTVVARACYNLVRRTFATCDTVFAEIDLQRTDVDRLFLAGGASQMPLVRDWVSAYFGLQPAADVPPFEVVALGASIAAREAFAG